MVAKILQGFKSIQRIINKGHDRSVKAKKNILLSILIKGISILISLILVPLTIHYINPSRYGIWLTLSSLMGWFGFFDIGFGHGLRNKLAESIAKGKHKLARIYVSITYAILCSIIVPLLIIFFFVNPFINWARILNAPPEIAAELGILALIVFVFFCLQFVLQLITIVITANQQPAKAAMFNLVGSFFSLVVIFILTKTTSGNLIYLGIALGFAPILVLIISSIWFYTHEYKRYAPSFKFVRFRYTKDLMHLGVKFFILQIAALILYETSNLVIAQLFGPSSVTSYNIAYKYFGVMTMVFGIITLPFWSAYTEAWVNKDIDWIKGSVKKLKLLWLFLSLVTLTMLFCSNFIYRLWVGKEIHVPVALSAVIAAYVIINAWNVIYVQFLNGIGKVKLQLYSGILAIFINIPMAIFFAKIFGIVGVVLSSVILSAINMGWTFVQYNKLINNKATGIWAQ